MSQYSISCFRVGRCLPFKSPFFKYWIIHTILSDLGVPRGLKKINMFTFVMQMVKTMSLSSHLQIEDF